MTSFLRTSLSVLPIGFYLGCEQPKETISFPTLPEIQPEAQELSTLKRLDSSKDYVIALVGEVRGELEPCGCPTLPYGGFARRNVALEDLRSKHTVFHLDAGETLLKGFFSNKDPSKEERARLISELSKDSGVDAWSVGPSDLMAVGLETLQTMSGPPRISATWLNAEGTYLFKPWILLEQQDIKLAVIGLSSHPTDPAWQILQTLPAKEALERVLPSIPSDVDLIVALGSMDDEEVLPLRQLFPTIALFLTTEGANFESPTHLQQASQIIEAPKQGRFIQTIYIHQQAGNEWMHSGLSEAQWRQWILGERTSTNAMYDTIHTIGAGRNLYFTELIPLSLEYEPKHETSLSQSKITTFSNARIQQSEAIAQQPTTSQDPGFAASGRCAQCHTVEMAKWSFTSHARAWESLIDHPGTENTQNPECIACHSTGFGKVGGFGEPTAGNLRKFKAVQCEACHGPLKGHPNDKSILPTPITPETCLPCHDSANSPNFDFETYLPKATCQSQ